MRFTLLAGTAILLFAAMPSAAQADCLLDLEEARAAFGKPGQASDALRQSFETSYETATRLAESEPAACQAIAARLNSLARLAQVPVPPAAPIARALRAMQAEAAASVDIASIATRNSAEAGNGPAVAAESAADRVVEITVMNTHDVRIQGLDDSVRAIVADAAMKMDEAQQAVRQLYEEVFSDSIYFTSAEKVALDQAFARRDAARAEFQSSIDYMNDWLEASSPSPETPGKPGKEPAPKEDEEPVISDLEGYLEQVCAPEVTMRLNYAVGGCTFWDPQDRTVPGPRREQPHLAEQPIQVIDKVQLEIDYMADQPRAGFRYFLKDHHIAEKGAGGVIEADPKGGLIIRFDLPRGRTGTARLSFWGGKAIVRGLAEIDYEVRHPAEPMDFTFDRDHGNFVDLEQEEEPAPTS